MSGIEFKQLRKLTGLSQVKLAVILDYDPSTVSKWECGVIPVPKIAVLATQAVLAKLHIQKS